MKTLRNSVPSGIRKVISIVVIVSMLMSLVGCKKAAATSESNGTSEGAVTVSETSSDSSAANGSTEPAGSELSESEATTAAPVSGAYTYTVYGDIQLSMDVNVDDYIFTASDGMKCFRIAQLAYDLGWLGNDEYSEIYDDIEESYRPSYYTFHDGDLSVRIFLDKYHEENLPNTLNGQVALAGVSYHYDNAGEYGDYYTAEDCASNPSHRSLSVNFAKHYSDCDYCTIGDGWYLSYDDIVVLSYIFWAESINAGNNSLVEAIGIDSDYSSVDAFIIQYNLP